jgi:parallel beta-helix repeat protein
MKMRQLLILTAIALFFTSGVFAQAVYMSPSGRDTNTGTKSQPFASLAAALHYVRTLRKSQRVSGAVEIIIAPGIYPLTDPLVLTAEDSSLTIKAAGPDKPVFTGGSRPGTLEKTTDGRWKIRFRGLTANIHTVQQLFINGRRCVRARTPNADTCFTDISVSETLLDSTSAIQKIRLTAQQYKALQTDKPDSQTVISILHAWDRTRKYIRDLPASDSAVSIAGLPMKKWNRLDNVAQFYFENAAKFLDAPGEWFPDADGALLYIPLQGENIGTSVAIVPLIDDLLIIRGDNTHRAANVRFKNITFEYTRYLMPAAGNEPAQAAAPTDAAVMIDHASGIYFDNCEIAHTGNNAIWFRADCNNSGITHSYLHDLGIGGVKIGEMGLPANDADVTRNITVDNNIIRSGGYEFPTGVGVLIFQASDNIVSHNEIADFKYSGVSAGWIWGYKKSLTKRNMIIFNHIHHLGQNLLSDMGGVYTLGPSEGTIVSNNVIHDIYAYGYGGWGLYTDEGSTGILLKNNLVYDCKSSGFHQHYGKDNIIRNNIFSSQLKAQLEATRVEGHRSFSFTHNIVYFDRGILLGKAAWTNIDCLADSNIYYDTRTKDVRFGSMNLQQWQQATGKDLHSIIADPQFTDAAGHDFTFRSKGTIIKVGFRPFNYDAAGVYGAAEWKRLARLPI